MMSSRDDHHETTSLAMGAISALSEVLNRSSLLYSVSSSFQRHARASRVRCARAQSRPASAILRASASLSTAHCTSVQARIYLRAHLLPLKWPLQRHLYGLLQVVEVCTTTVRPVALVKCTTEDPLSCTASGTRVHALASASTPSALSSAAQVPLTSGCAAGARQQGGAAARRSVWCPRQPVVLYTRHARAARCSQAAAAARALRGGARRGRREARC
jgi:hypothetical protein